VNLATIKVIRFSFFERYKFNTSFNVIVLVSISLCGKRKLFDILTLFHTLDTTVDTRLQQEENLEPN